MSPVNDKLATAIGRCKKELEGSCWRMLTPTLGDYLNADTLEPSIRCDIVLIMDPPK